ncbi:MAG TPA: alpha-2-macroglobulin family protein [Planctomycetota bacterium]|nr:alpha-2-macroglobulin family protein [Planctomycetota bacterium]
MLRTMPCLFSMVFLCFDAIGQDPATSCAEALLRGDAAAAARSAAAAAAPATRARLQAALLPLEQRPAAMLAVAQAFPAEADQALLAGTAALLLVERRPEAVPALAAWTERADEDSRYAPDTAALLPVVLGLRAALAARQQLGGDATLLRETARLLELASASRFGLWPARVACDAAWRRPEGLAEDLQLRALPCPPGHVGWDQIDGLPATAWQGALPHTGDLALPPLPRGNWLLEARSSAGPWRGLRTVEVSDLDAVALAAGGVMVFGAFDPAGPTAAQWHLRSGAGELAHGSIGAAPAIVAWSEHGEPRRDGCGLQLEGDAGSAWLEIHDGDIDRPRRPTWLAHGMVDRPLYRPGETVQGRIVLRSCTWAGDGLASVPSTAVAADQPLRVLVDLGSVGNVELPGRTDAHGVFSFSFVAPAELQPGSWLPFAVELPGADFDGKPLRVDAGTLCGTAFFRRQAVRVRVDGPDLVPAGTAFAEIAAIAEWSSGGPAAGLDVRAHVTVRADGEHEQAVTLRTGDDGRCVVRVPLAALGVSWAWIDFDVTGPDGQLVHERHLVQVVQRDAREVAQTKEGQDRLELDLGPAIVGADCRVSLRGAPQQHAVLVTGRGTNARAEAVQFDADGLAHADVPVLRLDWPRLDVTVATREQHSRSSVAVALRAQRPPVLELPAHASPGEEVAMRVVTDAPGTVVTVAVVDERIYELQPDRTPDPNDALRPDLPWWRWGHVWAPPRLDPAALVGSLLREGRIPAIDDNMRDLSRDWSAAGSAGPSTGGPGGVRSDFRATAAFVTVVADANGTANVHFALPSDLTTWRITAVGIDAEGTGFQTMRTLASRQPLAAEPLLPRALRAGDEFELPISVDRSADTNAATDTARVTAAIEGDALQVTRAPRDVAVPAGRVVRTIAELHAVAAGTAKLSLEAALGEHSDRSQREVSVGRDAVVRPLQAAALGTGEVTVALPEGTSQGSGLTVDVLLGGAAAWRQLEQDLARYPYGCVEQTLSRLVPYFAAARAAKQRGEPLPAMDAAFRLRLHGGLARLRDLQHFRGGFAFWPGGDVDPGMTALALHALALLREGGYDPAQADLRVDANDSTFRDALSRLRARELTFDASLVPAAELAIAFTRFVPDNTVARDATARLLELLPQLPAGLCARLGLVRQTIGDEQGAHRCLERLAASATPPLAPDAFPGEDPLAVQALQLELANVLHADPAQAQQRAADLLLACLQGHGSTYAHACALAALAQVLPRAPDVTANIEVRAGGAVRTFALGGKAGDVMHWRLANVAAVTVRGPAGVPLLVRISTQRVEPASGHAAWQAPVQVERDLCISRADATWQERRDGLDLVPLSGPPIAGRAIVLRLRVQSPVPMRFVVVECPLPAGFELGGAIAGVDRFDDRIVCTCDLAAGVPCVRRFDVVPTVAGRFLWPPATAAPMYVSGLEGGTTGSWLEVVAAPPGAVPALVTCFTTPWPPLPDDEDAFGAFFSALHQAWYREPADEARSRREVEALLASVPDVTDADRARWLVGLTSLLERLDAPRLAAERPEARWRLGAFDRLHTLLHDATLALFARLPASADDGDADEWWALARAVGSWPANLARESMLARLLARATSPELEISLIDYLGAPAADPAMCCALRACLASPDARVRHAAFAALPHDEQMALPPVLVIGAQRGAFDDGVIRLLAASEAGRAELRLRLCDADFVVTQRDRLDEELPAELWRAVPLAGFRSLAAVTIEHAGDVGESPALTQHVASGPFPTADLQQAMAAAIEPAWRAVLAAALRQRSVRTTAPAAREGDELWPLWTRALALVEDDAVGAQAVLDGLAAQRAPQRLDIEAELLRSFALPPLLAAGTPDQLYAAHISMNEAAWRTAWARLDGAARTALLDHFQRNIGTAFVPDTATEAEAIWRFLLRGGEVAGAVQTLSMSAAGIACLRRHLAAGEGGTAAAAIRAAFAGELELDPVTLQPRADNVWPALVANLQRSGFGGEWTPQQQQQLAVLRLERGVGPAASR